MNKTEEKIYDAFFNAIPLRLKNDSIRINNDCVIYQCHDSILGIRNLKTNQVVYSTDGWDTKLTKTRLQAIGCDCRIKNGVIIWEDNIPLTTRSISTYSINWKRLCKLSNRK